ncbi:hypothetical protein F4780DRAFT_635266 [Xylariomycetidae sp. FL0641]|nr:hypothetical protein F4780DRAFT_635266 [Xylariomycetidae sp. FL0641]
MENVELSLKEEQRRARNRVAQRRHRQRKKHAGSWSNTNENGNTQPITAANPSTDLTPVPNPVGTLGPVTLPTPPWYSDDWPMARSINDSLMILSQFTESTGGRKSPASLARLICSGNHGDSSLMGTPGGGGGGSSDHPESLYDDTFSAQNRSMHELPQGNPVTLASRSQGNPAIDALFSPQNALMGTQGPDAALASYFPPQQPIIPKPQQVPFSAQNIHGPLRDDGHTGPKDPKRQSTGEMYIGNGSQSSYTDGSASPEPGGDRDANDHNTSALSQSAEDESLESRLQRVLSIVEDTGFESIDSMTSAYYTAQFSEGSTMGPIQSASRTRRLRPLLTALQNSTKSWSARERNGYNEGIVQAAELICSDELQGLYELQAHGRRSSSSGYRDWDNKNARSPHSVRKQTANHIRQIVSDHGTAEFLQKDKAMLQDLVRRMNSKPEQWY